MLYLGLFVLLPVVVILQRGYSDGLTNLQDALDNFGAWNAIKLTVVMAFLAAIINGVFGTLLAYGVSMMQVAAGQPAYYWQIMTPGAILGIIVGYATFTHRERPQPAAA